ncbi:MAG: GLPGLI family protein [Ginsengibacter sp.]
MKKLLMAGCTILLLNNVRAQQTSGTVTYVRTMQMQMHIIDDHQGEKTIPQSRTDKFELTFGNNQSLWKHAEEEMENDELGGNGNGVHIRMIGVGQDDVSYCNFDLAKKVDQRDMFEKKFIVTDSIKKLAWKLTGETQTLLGHVCQKAIAERPTKRMTMNMDNGKMERKEVDDTAKLVAWFTTDIPVPAGPEVAGQLPGLILMLDMGDGRTVYKATEISDKVKPDDIKEPVKGKKVTPDEFRAETNKMMDEMQQNHPGGNRTIRIQN